jgi:hypothetical protein
MAIIVPIAIFVFIVVVTGMLGKMGIEVLETRGK